MPDTEAPAEHCTLCLKQFPIDLRAQMKAKAAVERRTLHDWMVAQMRRLVQVDSRTRKK